MGLGWMIARRPRNHYHKLTKEDEKAMEKKSRRRWLKKVNGRVMGLRMSSTKKLKWRGFSMILVPRIVAGFYAELVNNMKLDGIYPTIIFSSQWGLPVLSQPSPRKPYRNFTYPSS